MKKYQIDNYIERIPSGYYKIPDVENISYEPKSDYQFSYNGRIHSNVLSKLLKTISYQSPPKKIKQETFSLTQGHVIGDYLEGLEIDEIVDYFRHLIILNRDQITWDIADTVLNYLDDIYIPRWKLPNNEVDKEFRNVLKIIVRWPKSEIIEELIFDYINTLEDNIGSKILENLDFTVFRKIIDKDHWNLKQLSSLYESLNYAIYQVGILEEDRFIPLIDDIEGIFESLNKKEYDNKLQKYLIKLLYINCTMRKSPEEVIQAKEIFSDIMYNLEKSDEYFENYNWILGSFFSKITSILFDFENNIMNRRLIIGELVDNFLKPSSVDFERWEQHIINSKLHPWIFSYLIEGYSNILYTLNEHILDLPLQDEKKKFENLLEKLSDFLLGLALKYLSSYTNQDNIYEAEVITSINQLQLSITQFQYLKNSILRIIKYNLLNKQYNRCSREDLLDMAYFSLSQFYSHEFRYLYQLEFMLSFNELPFEKLVHKIKTENTKSGSLLSSQTFEDECIRPFSVLFSFLDNQSGNLFELEKHFGEILLWFLSEWYFQLMQHDSLREEASVILTPFLSIMFIKLAIYYMEKNQETKAHLMILNDHFFKIVTGLSPLTKNASALENMIGEVLESMHDVYEEIDFNIDPQNYNLKTIISQNYSMRHAGLIKNRENTKSIDPNFSNVLILKYLEIRDKLTEFFYEVRNSTEDEITNVLIRQEYFELPEKDSISILGKIGINAPKAITNKYPFPFIRNLNQLAIAINLFPIEINLPKFDIKMNF